MIEGTIPSHRNASLVLTEKEIPQPSIKGPKIMVGCVGIGTFTGAVFLIVLLFVAGDINQVVDSKAGPLLQILLHATGNTAGGICLLMYVHILLSPMYTTH